jgi:hypothetical protein
MYKRKGVPFGAPFSPLTFTSVYITVCNIVSDSKHRQRLIQLLPMTSVATASRMTTARVSTTRRVRSTHMTATAMRTAVAGSATRSTSITWP